MQRWEGGGEYQKEEEKEKQRKEKGEKKKMRGNMEAKHHPGSPLRIREGLGQALWPYVKLKNLKNQ